MSAGVYITVDVECSMGGAWDDPSLRPVSPDRAVWGRFGRRRLGLPLICDALCEHGLKATFFVDAFMAEQGFEGAEEEICRYLLDRGQDVQLHVHPNHMHYALHLAGKPHPFTDRMDDLPAEQQRALLEEGMERLRGCTGRRPVAFRAGNMAANEQTLQQVAAAGLRIDSSYTFPYAGGQCGFSPAEPYNGTRWYGDVLELALSGFRQARVPGLQKAKPLDLVGVSFAECRQAVEQICAAGAEAVLILHSFSLFKVRNSRYDAGTPNRVVIRRLRALCRWLSARGNALPIGTCAGLADCIDRGAHTEMAVAPCALTRPADACGAIVRKAVQAANAVRWR